LPLKALTSANIP